MKKLLFLFIFGIATALLADPYPSDTAAHANDGQELSQAKTNRILNDARTGDNPLHIAGTVTGSGDASAANQTAVQANPGSDASKAVAVQGVTGGKAVAVSVGSITIGQLPASLGAKTSAASLSIAPATDATFAVSGTFWQATQPVSGTFFQATQPVSAASLPLPTGAATETTVAAILAKQPTTPALEGGNLATIATNTTGLNSLTKGSGTVDSTTLRAVLASDGPTVTALGATTDAAAADANGSINAHVRQVAKTAATVAFDSTSKQQVSVYGKNSVAGDTSILLDSSGRGITVGAAANAAAVAGNPVLIAGSAGASGTGNAATLFVHSTGAAAVVRSGGAIDANNNSNIAFMQASDASIYPLNTVINSYNGASWDRTRTPATFKAVTATASGDTAVWTPTTGKKFRVMGYSIETTADAATSGGARIEIILRDGTTAMAVKTATLVPAVAATSFGNNANTGWRWLGNGIISATANNVLNVNLSAALTSGEVVVNVCGTEE